MPDSAFDSCTAAARRHVRLRRLTSPMATIVGLVPASPRVLDIGCGHGLVALSLAWNGTARHVRGVDPDQRKICAARSAATALRLDGRCQFDRVGTDWTPDGEWDAITIVDVLYLLGSERARELVRAACTALAPGGTLLVKEMAATPRWKHVVDLTQERVATRVAGYTLGDRVEPVPVSTVQRWMMADGLHVRQLRLDRGYPHPHAAVVGRRPGASGEPG